MSATPGVPRQRAARTDRRPHRLPPPVIACPAQARVRQPLPSLPDLPGGDRAWPPVVHHLWEAAGRGELGRSIATAVQGACTAARTDDARWLSTWSVAAARLLLAAGRLADARAAARCALHVPRTTAGSDLAQFAAQDVLARVAMATGDGPSLRDATRDVARMTASRLTEVEAEGAWLHVLLRGRSATAGRDLGPLALPRARPSTWFRATPEVCDDTVLARLLTRADQHAEAAALLSAAADRRTSQPDRIDVAATHQAVVGVVERDPRASLRAASLFDRSGRRLAAAAAREDAAAGSSPGGGTRRAELLATAIRTYDRAGARADAARARAALDGPGAHRSPPGASRP